MEWLKHLWNAFKNVAIIFSFAVSFVLVVLLLVMSVPALRAALALKTGMVEPLLNDLDAAFVGLSEATIDTKVQVEGEPVNINFTLPLSRTLPIDFELSIEQNTVVALQQPVPLNLPAQFNLPGGGGTINGYVSLSLPAGSQTIPVRMNVPVNQTIPISMTVPVRIKLGQAGLGPAVQELRGVFRPLREQIESLPDGIELP